MSFLHHLECVGCGNWFQANSIQTFCQECQSPLLARYDLTSASQQLQRENFSHRAAGMWRWKELLPVAATENIISLGEGDTPLLHLPRLGARLGLSRLLVKDEGQNPTGTFKARGISAAVSKAKELGLRRFIIPTAGNAGGALASYAARGGFEAIIFMPADTPPANLVESRLAGAQVFLIDGLINQAASLAAEKAAEEDLFDLSTFKEPYRVEGKKIMGFELAESFEWELPDVIIYPTGGGTGLVGMWKAFNELVELGWLKAGRMPRLVAVQSEGCAPVVKAFLNNQDRCDLWTGGDTLASGLRVPKSFADRLILAYLRASKGTAVAVSDQAILEAQSDLGKIEGICTSPEGAATLAALPSLIQASWLDKNESIVLFNTGSGLKNLSG
jgi:threonine synthase